MPRSEVFLIEFFKQCQERMRQSSDFEYRLLWYLLLFFPIIGVMIATLYDSDITPLAYLIISGVVSLFLVAIAGIMTYKICHMHNKYHELGQYVKTISRYFELSIKNAYVDDEVIVPYERISKAQQEGFGSGNGYLKTLYIVWALTVAMIAVIITLGIFKFIS